MESDNKLAKLVWEEPARNDKTTQQVFSLKGELGPEDEWSVSIITLEKMVTIPKSRLIKIERPLPLPNPKGEP